MSLMIKNALAPLVTCVVVLCANPSLALPPLSEVKEIDDKMRSVAIAIEVSDQCGSIAPRTIKGVNFLWSLKRKASDLGYSDDEIKAYVDSDANEARIRKLGTQLVIAQGFDPTTSEGLCAFGKSEIAKKSIIGSLLRAR